MWQEPYAIYFYFKDYRDGNKQGKGIENFPVSAVIRKYVFIQTKHLRMKKRQRKYKYLEDCKMEWRAVWNITVRDTTLIWSLFSFILLSSLCLINSSINFVFFVVLVCDKKQKQQKKSQINESKIRQHQKI